MRPPRKLHFRQSRQISSPPAPASGFASRNAVEYVSPHRGAHPRRVGSWSETDKSAGAVVYERNRSKGRYQFACFPNSVVGRYLGIFRPNRKIPRSDRPHARCVAAKVMSSIAMPTRAARPLGSSLPPATVSISALTSACKKELDSMACVSRWWRRGEWRWRWGHGRRW